MRTLIQRVIVTIVSTILLAAAGALSGYLVGHEFALRHAETQLDHYANRVLLENVTSTAESRAVLATMNTSSYDLCSDEEIEYFRQIIFQAKYLEGRRPHAWRND